jgi:hypothetical protein
VRFSRPRSTRRPGVLHTGRDRSGRIKSQLESQGPQSQITPRDPPALFPVLIENFGGTPHSPSSLEPGTVTESVSRIAVGGLARRGRGPTTRHSPQCVTPCAYHAACFHSARHGRNH